MSLGLLAGALCILSASDSTRDSTRTSPIAISGFVDVYYAYDFGKPIARDRLFTTQAVRHNEANLNLAHLALSLERERVRGRLALQAGTSAQVNYSREPAIGQNSGATLSRHIQEAVVGVQLARPLWLDAGIYSSYIGWEGWISRDNPTYTRSLVAEYTPYYLSGVRLSWQVSSRLSIQGHVMNGWQKISEDNDSKAIGARLDFALTPEITLAYGGFVGNEQPDSAPAATRWFNQLMLKVHPSPNLLLQGQADYGREPNGTSSRDWYGAVAIARMQVSRAIALSTRLERFSDPDQVVATTGLGSGLVVNGASVGLDVSPLEGLLWRTELKGLWASAPLFSRDGLPNTRKSNGVMLTSLALLLE